MAYTLQELLVIGPPPPGSEDTVDVTLMITQEDGRSGWGATTLVLDSVARQARPRRLPMDLSFSDRDRFRGNADKVNLVVTDREAGLVTVEVQLLTWRATFSFPAQLVEDPGLVGKLYYGWGDTIGRGSGRALHVFSFTNYARRPIAVA